VNVEDDQQDPRPGGLDRLVEWLAQLMNALGLNGNRMLWRWRQKRRDLGETGMRTEVMLRSAKTKHKMCPSCRALVPRAAGSCPECGESLYAVRNPGVTRLLGNLIPGVRAATSLIMLVNGFWFVMLLMAQIKSGGGGSSIFSFSDLGLLVRFGAGLSRPTMLPSGAVVGGEWWRLITPVFLHAGLLHFFFNSFLLIYLGPMVEEIYGTARFWVIYLACGIGGSMASQLTRPTITVGASGAIMGLIGLLIVYAYRNGGTALGQNMKNLVFRLIVYSLIMSFAFNIDHRNHIGGFLCGALLALIVPSREYRSRGDATFWQLAAMAGVLLVLFAFLQVAIQARETAAF
jgi:membrane associated rhomboid family serine protease